MIAWQLLVTYGKEDTMKSSLGISYFEWRKLNSIKIDAYFAIFQYDLDKKKEITAPNFIAPIAVVSVISSSILPTHFCLSTLFIKSQSSHFPGSP